MTNLPELTIPSTKFPENVRIFPLPDHVLLPDLPMAFRVFEPRYKQLVNDLMELDEESRWIALPRLTGQWKQDYDGSPDFEPIAVLGRVVDVERLPEGHFKIVVRGILRAKLTEEPSDKSYRVARVELLPDRPLLDPDEASRRYRTVLQLTTALSGFLEDHVTELSAALSSAPDLETSVSRLGAVFLPNADWRQHFLEARRLELRLAMLEEVLAATLALAQSATGADTLPT